MSAYPDRASCRDDAAFARAVDEADPLAPFRAEFELPTNAAGEPVLYVCGNSLGPLPHRARRYALEEIADWGRLAVDGHFHARRPWYAYHELARESGARLVGALPGEVVAMNSLTVNLHLLMVSFYRPTAKRHRIVIEAGAFPSDLYAVESQIRYHGHDPREALVIAAPRPGEHLLRTEDVVELIEREGDGIALVLLGGVHYYTGQWHDMPAITAAAHRAGAIAGWDLAHAAGNVPLALHDWDVDFAAWCSYKYLNAGPGAVAGAFVHERHGHDAARPRFAGWWGNDPATRFAMHTERCFVPQSGAAGWQLSNPPVLALAPVVASLELFDEARIDRLRAKSIALTGYLEFLLERGHGAPIEVITPRDPGARGCQLSLRVPGGGRDYFERVTARGVVADYREPDVVRVAPAPLFNTFDEVRRLAAILREVL